jgi:hypothetical protein
MSTGLLMTLTGFLFLAEPLLIEVDSSVAYTLGPVMANWWTVPFAMLILAFPSGGSHRGSTRASRSPTMASAERTTGADRACAASPIASRRSMAACASQALPARGPS